VVAVGGPLGPTPEYYWQFLPVPPNHTKLSSASGLRKRTAISGKMTCR